MAPIVRYRDDIGQKTPENASPDPPDVLGAGPQVGVLCTLEHLGVLCVTAADTSRFPKPPP